MQALQVRSSKPRATASNLWLRIRKMPLDSQAQEDMDQTKGFSTSIGQQLESLKGLGATAQSQKGIQISKASDLVRARKGCAERCADGRANITKCRRIKTSRQTWIFWSKQKASTKQIELAHFRSHRTTRKRHLETFGGIKPVPGVCDEVIATGHCPK